MSSCATSAGSQCSDLSQADFEVLEDGVLQAIGSFTRVFELPAGTKPATPSAPAASIPGTPTAAAGTAAVAHTGPGITALVFDRLNPEARRLAAQAARNYLGNKEESPNFIGVFGIDLSLAPYAPFTRNAVALRQALDNMVKSASSASPARSSSRHSRAPTGRPRRQIRRRLPPSPVPAALLAPRLWEAHRPPRSSPGCRRR